MGELSTSHNLQYRKITQIWLYGKTSHEQKFAQKREFSFSPFFPYFCRLKSSFTHLFRPFIAMQDNFMSVP